MENQLDSPHQVDVDDSEVLIADTPTFNTLNIDENSDGDPHFDTAPQDFGFNPQAANFNPQTLGQQLPIDNSNPANTQMMLMLQMQQQQIQMQAQMTQFMSKIMDMETKQRQTDKNESSPKNLERLERPKIHPDSTDNRWIIFLDEWERYKDMAKLNDPKKIRQELRLSCSTPVNDLLFNFIGPDALNIASEEVLLKYIKSVAVKKVHPEVYRQQFFVMKQADGESITNYTSRLKSQAMLCQFKRNCDCKSNQCTSSYSEDMIRSQLIAGLRNSSHQVKVLSEIATLATLDALIERLLTLESTEKAAHHFQPGNTPLESKSNAIKSEYQKRKFQKPKPISKESKNSEPPKPIVKDAKCYGCGEEMHGNKWRDKAANVEDITTLAVYAKVEVYNQKTQLSRKTRLHQKTTSLLTYPQ